MFVVGTLLGEVVAAAHASARPPALKERERFREGVFGGIAVRVCLLKRCGQWKRSGLSKRQGGDWD